MRKGQMGIQARQGRAGYHHGDLRAALLAAAEDELTDRGIEGFTLRGVAKRAGVSHAAPAHHFRDTSALLTALAAVAAARFCEAMTAEQERAGTDPAERFIASGVAYVDFALANPAMFGLMFGSKRPDITDDAFVVPFSRAFSILVEGITALRREDPMASGEGRIDIASSWALVHGLAELLIAQRMRFLRDDLEKDSRGTIRALVARTLRGQGFREALRKLPTSEG